MLCDTHTGVEDSNRGDISPIVQMNTAVFGRSKRNVPMICVHECWGRMKTDLYSTVSPLSQCFTLTHFKDTGLDRNTWEKE